MLLISEDSQVASPLMSHLDDQWTRAWERRVCGGRKLTVQRTDKVGRGTGVLGEARREVEGLLSGGL